MKHHFSYGYYLHPWSYLEKKTYLVCFGLHVQHLIELTRPVVKEIGRGGSVEADSGTF